MERDIGALEARIDELSSRVHRTSGRMMELEKRISRLYLLLTALSAIIISDHSALGALFQILR